MAVQPRTAGPVTVKVNANQGAGIETLGFSRDGTEIELNWAVDEVPGDERGGSAGFPIDFIHLALSATIRILLSSWDPDVLDKIAARQGDDTAGTAADPGDILFTDSNKTYRLILDSSIALDYNFPRAIPRGVQTLTTGSKHSEYLLIFEAYPNASNILYNSTTS